jgi:hypothetical protein
MRATVQPPRSACQHYHTAPCSWRSALTMRNAQHRRYNTCHCGAMSQDTKPNARVPWAHANQSMAPGLPPPLAKSLLLLINRPAPHLRTTRRKYVDYKLAVYAATVVARTTRAAATALRAAENTHAPDIINNGYPGVALFNSTRALLNSARVPTRVCGPYRSKNTALGVFRTPGGVLGTCFALQFTSIGGIFGQLATRANGHLGFGVFIASQCS